MVDEKKREIYRRVFGTVEGRVVLTDILNDLGHFAEDLSEQDTALSNYAKTLLEKLGIWQPHNLKRLVDAYMNMPYLATPVGEENTDD